MFLGTKTLNVGLRVTIDDGVLISELNRPKAIQQLALEQENSRYVVRKSDVALSIPCLDSYFDLFVSPLGETMHHCK